MMCKTASLVGEEARVQTDAGGQVGSGKQLGAGHCAASPGASGIRPERVHHDFGLGSKDSADGRLACSLNLPTWAAMCVEIGAAATALQPKAPTSRPAR
ncbi:hypothetical protein MAPG_05855 [Magnaporthiopsis poae ATCC 64411]|uniref:Uncharacterized protein n=1 Tax=Magnaporthiopsis poae (strain ATCC 64411 / 73-15) TaxID=644358 RepID=A0A0C4E0I0_MAGP6|nr:hypothetical protein MAPG_05855 [Magnaporthiopsis poae ATCC 64411]